MSLGQHALQLTLMLAAPLLIVALVTGLVIGAFQAATQINEMTLSFIPKLIAMAATLVIAGPWMLKLIVGYTRELFESIPMLIS
jgi:flagellar biosynthetic protein FliQ